MKKWESIFDEEERTISLASKLVRSSTGSVDVEDYEILLSQYKKLYRQSLRLVKMGDRIQGQLNRLYEKLTRSEEKYRNIFERSLQGIYRSSPDGRFIDVNPSMAAIFGYSKPEEMVTCIKDIGEDLFFAPDQRKEFLHQVGTEENVSGRSLRLRRKDGESIWVEVSAKGLFDEQGKLLEIQGLLADVTEKRQRLESLKTLARMDGLTGLWNRAYFLELGDGLVSQAKRNSTPLSLVYFDLDRFKRINDSHGHQCGDQVLKTMSAIIKALLREEDVFGRMGGDEFAILLPETNTDGARRVAERLRMALVKEPHDLNGVTASFSASFGIAQLGDKAPSLSTLIKQADLALYESKNRGRNRVSCHGRQVLHEYSFSTLATGVNAVKS